MSDDTLVEDVKVDLGGRDGTAPPKVKVTDEAPWGLKADGTPYKRDPSRYQGRGKGRAKGGKGKDYRPDVRGLVQVVGMPLAVAGQANEAFLADAVALEAQSEPIVEAVNELALRNARVAAALEKLATVGPYGLLLSAVSPLVLQVAVNHGALPAGMMGTVPPGALVAALVPEQPERPAGTV